MEDMDQLPVKRRRVDEGQVGQDGTEDSTLQHRLSIAVVGNQAQKCPYLDTIDRQALDFDMDKVCSVTLTTMNVYCCLVCGKFFQGRGTQTPAYTHSVQAGHFVWIHLQSAKTYCLPDGYEIHDSALNDVKHCLQPTFSAREIALLDQNKTLSRDIHGVAYLPGFIGLNNVMQADYVNVILHALSHIQPLRDFFLQPVNYADTRSSLVRKFGELLRKMWSPGNFKSVLSPQELINDISVGGKDKVVLRGGHQTECIELWNWLVGELAQGLAGEAPPAAADSIFSQSFSGLVELSETRTAADGTETSSSKSVGFKYLSLPIPPPPLFRDAEGGLIIPQVPIFDLLRKFDGETCTEEIVKGVTIRKKYRLRKLPRYLVFNLDRKGKNNFSTSAADADKNRTIVTFPAKNLEMRDYFNPGGGACEGPTKYNLVANVCYRHADAANQKSITIGAQSGAATVTKKAKSDKGAAEKNAALGSFLVHVHNKATDQWFEMQDLNVTEILAHQIGKRFRSLHSVLSLNPLTLPIQIRLSSTSIPHSTLSPTTRSPL